jgi:putative nucleotidyltransferase with HDIG domain
MGALHPHRGCAMATIYETLKRWKQAMELRDPGTGSHSHRVTRLVTGTLAELGCPGPEAEPIIWAASIHDIGKLGISNTVLAKQGSLTAQERTVIEQHATLGAELLACYPELGQVAEIIRHHHEQWNGRGYPDRLAGKEIPFGGRVIAVADSFDAMTSDRPYRLAMPVEHAVAILYAGRWHQWDGEIVDAFLRVIWKQEPARGTMDAASAPPLRSCRQLSVPAASHRMCTLAG